MIPNFAVIGFHTQEWHGFHRVWVPLFLLWIPVILLSPVIFLVLAVIAVAAGTNIWRLIGIFWNILANLRGTDVRVVVEGNHIQVRIL
jgi:hypothetical protein